MAKYFFNVHDGESYPDENGEVLPNVEAARRYAAQYAGALFQDQTKDFSAIADWRMEVSDDKGLVLFCLMFMSYDAPALQRRFSVA